MVASTRSATKGIAPVAVVAPVEMTSSKHTMNIVASTRSASKGITRISVIEPVEMTSSKHTINIVASTRSATKGIAPVEMTTLMLKSPLCFCPFAFFNTLEK